MRNKWFVGGILLPALLLAWATIWALRHDMGFFSVIPAGLAIGLCYGAWKVSQAQSFGPVPPLRWDAGTNQAVRRWNNERDARNKAAKNTAQPTPNIKV